MDVDKLKRKYLKFHNHLEADKQIRGNDFDLNKYIDNFIKHNEDTH